MATNLSKPRRHGLRLVLVMFGTAAATLVAEVALRIVAWRQDLAAIRAWEQVGIAMPRDGQAHLMHIIRPSDNQRIIYELRPNLDVQYEGAATRTNSVGFRCPDHPVAKPPNRFRIVGIGDSGLFGLGIGDDENFLAVVNERLNGTDANRPFEAINTGVPGYNTVMEVETLAVKGLAYSPDLVVVAWCGNDLDLPNFIGNPDDYFSLTKSYLLERVVFACHGIDRLAQRPLVDSPRQPDLFTRENDPDRVPPQYREMVGLDAYRSAMRRLRSLSQRHGFDVVVVCHTRGHDYVREICAELGFPQLDAGPRVEEYMRRKGIERYLGSEMSVSATDPHGSAITHRLIADVLWEHLGDHPRIRAFRDRN